MRSLIVYRMRFWQGFFDYTCNKLDIYVTRIRAVHLSLSCLSCLRLCVQVRLQRGLLLLDRLANEPGRVELL